MKRTTIAAQFVMQAEFTWSFDDTMANTAGNTVNFGLTNLGGASGIFDVITLPYGAVVLGGTLITDTAFDTAAYTVSVGDSVDSERYLPAFDRKATGKSDLLAYGRRSQGESVRLTLTNADVCTTGKATLRVFFTLDGRANEVL